MRMKRSQWIVFGFFCALCALGLVLVLAFAYDSEEKGLAVSFLDVGQGDAIFIESPTGTQVLIDAGGNRAVLRELSREMSWFDRSIDIALATHPDQDHIGGFPDVFARYHIPLTLHSSVEDDGSDERAFDRAVLEEVSSGATQRTAVRGDVFDLGGGASLEILFPDRPVPEIETNTGSVIARLVYGKTAFLFTGDAPSSIEKYLVRLDEENLRADVLKAGHHGSRTSSSEEFVRAVAPQVVVISRGCDNKYGHPHAEVLGIFARARVPILDTCEEGTIQFVSDGESVVRK